MQLLGLAVPGFPTAELRLLKTEGKSSAANPSLQSQKLPNASLRSLDTEKNQEKGVDNCSEQQLPSKAAGTFGNKASQLLDDKDRDYHSVAALKRPFEGVKEELQVGGKFARRT